MSRASTEELDATLDAASLEGADETVQRVLAVGDVLADRYTLEAELGRGGMGTVFRAHDAALGEPVALKLLDRVSAATLDRFRREVRLARRVTHPNIARTHDLGAAIGAHFLTMELVHGASLDVVLARDGALPLERALEITRAVLRGLAAAHAVGVIHRDLKPANVLLADDGRILITDFGIAGSTHEAERDEGVVGTAAYMAPEQARGGSFDARTDLFALGVLVFEMLSGELPFDGATPMELVMARLRDPPRELGSLLDVPPEISALVRDLLAKDPDDRPPTAGAVSARLSPRTTPSEASRPFAPVLAPQVSALAVLPFTYRGPDDLGDLGVSLAEETVDVLSRTEGLRVLSFAATSRVADPGDPIRVARELRADSIVEGSVRLSGSRVRVKARLVGEDGVQRWSDELDAPLGDVFELCETMAKRIAELLRVQINARAQAGVAGVPREALERYFAARRLLRNDLLRSAPEAAVLLEECLALAPSFSLARAAHAIASVRAWWSGITIGRDGAERAERSVADAVRLAPDLAETHFARAMLQLQRGDYRECARALGRSLQIAPTFGEAQHYLGGLQLETGRLEEGTRRIELAQALCPSSRSTITVRARERGLVGDFEGAAGLADEVAAIVGDSDPAVIVMRLRAALWARDLEEVRRQGERFGRLGGPSEQFSRFVGFARGELEREPAENLLRSLPRVTANRRFISLCWQIAAETFACAGDYELTLDALRTLSEGAFIDVAWLRRCVLFEPLREDPGFREIEAKVSAQASAVWAP